MSFNLSDRIGAKGRMADDGGSGFRANPFDGGFNLSDDDRGGTGAEQSQMGGSHSVPHSSSGFRRALEKTERNQGKLSGSIAAKAGGNQPNYFAQGGKRHGMHIGNGAPFTGSAEQEGMDTGE
jgi:hypothetical protein